jgi:hypothetical protein
MSEPMEIDGKLHWSEESVGALKAAYKKGFTTATAACKALGWNTVKKHKVQNKIGSMKSNNLLENIPGR